MQVGEEKKTSMREKATGNTELKKKEVTFKNYSEKKCLKRPAGSYRSDEGELGYVK